MGIENPIHILFVAIVALVVLGPRRLPELAKTLGNGIREFRESVDLGGTHGRSEAPAAQASAAQAPPPPGPVAHAPLQPAAAPVEVSPEQSSTAVAPASAPSPEEA